MKNILVYLLLLFSVTIYARPYAGHRADFYSVLPFEQSAKLDKWLRFISWDLIDNYKGEPLKIYNNMNFYDYLKSKYPPFKCKHRVLFHWGYNSTPWSYELEKKCREYRWSKAKIDAFKLAITKEQQRRNALANRLTEETFRMSHGGKDASYANALISIVYDVHLLGDYTPDNTDFVGLQSFTSVIGDIINSIRKLDYQGSKYIVRKIQNSANRSNISVHVRAQDVLNLLSKELPLFIRKAQGGSLYRRWSNALRVR